MSQLNSPFSSPPNFDGEKSSNKFKKLLSNKLQGKVFHNLDLYNNFKTPSRNSFLEKQHVKSWTQSNMSIQLPEAISPLSTFHPNNSTTHFSSQQISISTSNGFDQLANPQFDFEKKDQILLSSNQSQRLRQMHDNYQHYMETPQTPKFNFGKISQLNDTPVYKKMRVISKSTTGKLSKIQSTPNFSPQRRNIEQQINLAKIPLDLVTEATPNQQLQPSNPFNSTQNSFFQVQYLSRTKDKKFYDLLAKSKPDNSTLLKTMDIPSYQDYTQFMKRQKALHSLIQEYTKTDNFFNPNTNKSNNPQSENQQLNQYYNVKGGNSIFKQSKYQNESASVQGRVDKNYFFKSTDFKKIALDEVDQNLFESYLDLLKNNYALSMTMAASPTNQNLKLNIKNKNLNNNNNNNNNNSIAGTLPVQSPKNFDSSLASSINKDRSPQNGKNLLSKSTTLFNPNAFAQENYISQSKRKSIMIQKIDRMKGKQQQQQQQLNQNGSIDSNDQIIENFNSNRRDQQSEQKISSDQMDKLQQQIKNNTFSVINSPKATKFEDSKVIVNRPFQNSPTRQTKVGENKQESEMMICDILEDGGQDESLAQQLSFQRKQRNQKTHQIVNKQQTELKGRIEDIEVSINQIIDYINELKQLYNSNIQLSNQITKVPGFNDLMRSFVFKDSLTNELIGHITLHQALKSILIYLQSKLNMQQLNHFTEQLNSNRDSIVIGLEAKIDQQFMEIPLDVLEDISKQIVCFSRSVFSIVQQKREVHQKQKVEDIKIEIQQITSKTHQQFNHLINQVPLKTQNVAKLQHMQNNLKHIIDRNQYIKQQPFIEKFENKEEHLGQFKKVSEVSRNKSKHLNEMNDILRNFYKFA